uniref:Uncharacterized protein n=1 Tax=Strigamia maritima TaxID=126957 RepID=T1JDM0_STRMM
SSRTCGSKGAIRRRDYTPTKWNKCFETYEDVIINGGDLSFLISILELIECQIAAMDLRGHGDTVTSNDEDLSAQTLSEYHLVNCEHMRGGVAVRTAYRELVSQLIGLAVIDVVEGTAMDALQSMQSFLRSRPATFRSIEASIEWCAGIYTHKSATTHLELEESTSSEHSLNESSKILKVPSSDNSIPGEQEEINTISEEKKDEDKETISQKKSGVDLATEHGEGAMKL